ncbi:hypothetical protein [Vampirovibrio sp.]|uniref:hypothetical protein n=1 Tax=Vampirovibrio sp. TaxID=2717857 RepID=UPI0035936F91
MLVLTLKGKGIPHHRSEIAWVSRRPSHPKKKTPIPNTLSNASVEMALKRNN